MAKTAASGIVFRGTVQRVKASTVHDIRPDANTSIVHVDEVVAAPSALAHLAGRDITVVTQGRGALKAGQRATFHAGSLSFGDEVAVRSTAIEPLPSSAPMAGMTAARAAAAPLAAAGHVASADPVQTHRDLQLKQNLDAADVVVTGTVSAVRMAADTVAMGAPGRGRAKPEPAWISEHDPLWHEAVVNIESVEKGSARQRQVVVRFPSSNDVRWKHHSKLIPGQQGVFLLSRSTAGKAGRAPMLATSAAQPISAIEKIRELLRQRRSSKK